MMLMFMLLKLLFPLLPFKTKNSNNEIATKHYSINVDYVEWKNNDYLR